jgi:hypothetical protein
MKFFSTATTGKRVSAHSFNSVRPDVSAKATRTAKRLKYAGVGQRLVKEPIFLTLEPDGSDTWRLDPIVQLLKDGAVRPSAVTCSSH